MTTIASSTATVIHDVAHAPVSSVAAGTMVHDQATVTGQVGLRHADGDGDVLLVHQRHLHGTGGGHFEPVALDAAGVADAHRVPADAAHRWGVRVPGDLFG